LANIQNVDKDNVVCGLLVSENNTLLIKQVSKVVLINYLSEAHNTLRRLLHLKYLHPK